MGNGLVRIRNQSINTSFDVEIIERAVSLTLLAHKADDYEVSILLTDDDYITKLNHEYRSKESPTDVLAFPMLVNDDSNLVGSTLLGDVVVSLETADRQAKTEMHSLEDEVAFLTVHGVLHLLGYDHDTSKDANQMFKMQNEILHQMQIERKTDAST